MDTTLDMGGEDMNEAIRQSAAQEVTDAVPPPTDPTMARPNPPAPVNPAAPPVAPHARLFDRILSNIGGGPVNVQMPDGTSRAVPQSRGTMAKSIVAGALAGMFSGGSSEVASGFGNAPKISPEAALSEGFQGGKNYREGLDREAQRKVDETQSRQMTNFSNNAKVMQQMIALAAQGHQNLDPVVQNNKQGIIAAADAYDNSRPSGEPSIFLERGLQAHDAMSLYDSKGGKHMLTDSNVVLEGTTDVRNPQTGVMEPHPIYSVIRPEAKLKLTEDQTKALAKYFPQMDSAWSATGGNVNMDAAKYNAANLKVNSLIHMDSLINSLAKDMGRDPIDFAAEFRKNPNAMMHAVDSVEQMMAQKHDGSQPDQILSAMQSAPNGDMLTKMLGTPGEVGQFIEDQKADRIQQEAKAKTMGALQAGIKDPKTALAIISNPNADPSLKEMAGAYLEADTAHTLAKAAATAKGKAQAEQDSPMILQAASNIVRGAELGKVNDLVSRGGNYKAALSNALVSQAELRGLNPADFSPAALESKSNTYQDYTSTKSKTSTRSQLNSFDTYLRHADDAREAIMRLQAKGTKIRGIPVMNIPMNELAKLVTGDADVKALQTALLSPRKEFMSFLNAGRAEHDKDIDAMDAVLNEQNSNPSQLLTALTGLTRSADDRVAGLARGYIGTMNGTLPSMLSPEARRIIKGFGVTSVSDKLTKELPKGNWQMLDKANIQPFLDAAAGDKDIARKLARYNGWYTDQSQMQASANPPQAAPQE